MRPPRKVFLVLGNQLFPVEHLRRHKSALVFMAEDHGSCTYVRHHKHKLILILAAMRAHADTLRREGFRVHYERLDEASHGVSYTEKLRLLLSLTGFRELVHFEIEDKSMERRIARFAKRYRLKHTILPSPMFLTSRTEFKDWLGDRKQPRMSDFYRWQRRRLNILVNENGEPAGKRWSFDAENRKRLPVTLPVPELPEIVQDDTVREVALEVQRCFPNHPGRVDNFALPTTRDQALDWLHDFLEQRLTCFGDYEDALTTRSDHVFHSMLSPLMNIGLLTPDEIMQRTLRFGEYENIALNNIEGFTRQIIGWREFMRGTYQNFGAAMMRRNFWGHHRRIRADWYQGTTGILPLDSVIGKANRIGWAHHIERLMIAGNLMTLAEIHPRDAYRWFMEMFVDSAEWVMVPNVFGMALFADGGIFTTKPYICGSNYVRRMGDYPNGDWTATMDALFWRFIAQHRDFFTAQPRLGMMVRNLDRQNPERRSALNQRAEEFLRKKTDSIGEVA